LAYADHALRVIFWGDEIESIESLDPLTNLTIKAFDDYMIYPANIFVTTKERIHQAIKFIQDDLTGASGSYERTGKKAGSKTTGGTG
jgi:excinuclease ABC subunit B